MPQDGQIKFAHVGISHTSGCCKIVSIANNEAGLDNTKISKQTHFLLCETCLWCASYLRRKGRVESIPISDNDVYSFDYDPKRGITLEFSKLEKDKG